MGTALACSRVPTVDPAPDNAVRNPRIVARLGEGRRHGPKAVAVCRPDQFVQCVAAVTSPAAA